MPENPSPSGFLQPDAANNGNAGAGAIDALSLFRRLSSATIATSFQPSQRDQFGGQIYNRSNTTLANLATQLGYSAIGSGNRSTAVGSFAYAREDSSVALGVYALALGPSSVAIGDQASSSAYRSISIGNQGQGSGFGSIAIGFQARATGTGAIAIGTLAFDSGAGSVAVGASSRITVGGSVAIGPIATVTATLGNGIAIGQNASVTGAGTEGIAIGDNAAVSAARAQAYGNLAVAAFADSVAFGRGTATTLTNQMMVGNPTFPLSVNISGPTPWVDVIAYGAMGDGIQDDTLFIQAAINKITAIGGGIVFVPIGTYKITAALDIFTNVKFIGADREASIIYAPNTGHIGMNLYSGSRVMDMTARGPNSASVSSLGLNSGNRNYVTIENVIIEKWGSNAINSGGTSSYWTLQNVICRNNFNEGMLITGQSNYWVIDNFTAHSNRFNGIDISGVGHKLSNIYLYQNGGDSSHASSIDQDGLLIVADSSTSTTSDIEITNIHTYLNNTHGVRIQATVSATVERVRITNLISNNNGTGDGSGNPTNQFGDGLIIDANAAMILQDIAVSGIATSNTRYGFAVIATGSGTINRINFGNCTSLSHTAWSGGGGAVGFLLFGAGVSDTVIGNSLSLLNTTQYSDTSTTRTVVTSLVQDVSGQVYVYPGASLHGDLRLENAGNGILVKRGTNSTFGIVTLSGAGTAIIYSTKITTSGSIFLAGMNTSGTAGAVYISTSTNLVSATVASTNAADTRDVHWWIVNPA